MLTDWLSGEGLFPGLQTPVFSLYPHRVERQDGGSKICRVSFYKGTNSIVSAPASSPNYPSQAASHTHHTGDEAFTIGILGENIESIAVKYLRNKNVRNGTIEFRNVCEY